MPLDPHSDPGPNPGAPRNRKRLRLLAAGAAVGAVVVLLLGFKARRPPVAAAPASSETRAAPPVAELPAPRNFPDQDTVSLQGRRWVTRYEPDSLLQARTRVYLERYRPEGAVVLVCDLRTGMVRALAERDSTGLRSRPELAFGDYPAASLAKILTTCAAMEQGLGPEDSLPLIGRSHTLYRSQLRVPEHGRYPKIALREAFARSTNPAFGVLGLNLGPEPLRRMGRKLGFGSGDDPGSNRIVIPDSGYGLAEVACGFVTSTTISPWHALLLARAIGDDGRLVAPRFSAGLRALDGDAEQDLPVAAADPFAPPADLDRLRGMMAATVSIGTARKGFRRNFRREDFETLEVGGKTGSLDGPLKVPIASPAALNPDGTPAPPRTRSRYEWYMGYARTKADPAQGIAVAVMLVNHNYLAVHAGELSALVIRDWARALRKNAARPSASVAAR